MNKKILIYVMLLVAAGLFAGCQDRLQEEFQDPEKHAPRPDQIIPGMLTQMLNTRFFVLDYGEWYYNLDGFGVAQSVQIAVRRPHPSEAGYYEVWQNLDGSGDWAYYHGVGQGPSPRFNRYYTDLKNWGLMRDDVETMEGQDFADNEMFFLAATAIKDAIGLQTVDLFNKIPYSEAFQGTKGVFFPKYDEAKDIYMAILDDLSDLASRIPGAHSAMSEKAKAAFTKNDLAFGGDPQKWVQYINSVRLRHAVRMSGVDEAFAKTHIAAAIQNLPTVDFIWPNTQKNQNRLNGGGGGIYPRSIYEQAGATLIPNIVMQSMNHGDLDYVEGEDDPRLPVIANPSRYSIETPDKYQFNGVSMDYDSQYPYWPNQLAPAGTVVDNGFGLTVRTFTNSPTNISAWLRSGYSQYNIGTFTFGNIPSYMTSLAENDLLLAEVAAKGLATTGKSAADHIHDAVVHSTDMWYYINSLTNIWQTEGMPDQTDFLTKAFQPAKPSATIIEQYADKVRTEFAAVSGIEDQMEVIMKQKYIHLNILNIYELWAELRRTRHPRIEKSRIDGDIKAPFPERARYPNSELQNNPDSYMEVISEDNFTSPIFWVPDNKKNESYYMDEWLPLKGFLPLPDPNPNRVETGFGTWTVPAM